MTKETRRTRRRSGGGRAIAFLIGFAFLGFAVGLSALQLVPELDDYRRMRDWVSVEAEILSTRIISHSSPKSATTSSVEARYRYRYRGMTYEGGRVGIAAHADNIGSWHQDMHRRLRQAEANRRPVKVWIDPTNPADSVIDRNLRWGLTVLKLSIVTLFAGIGVLLLLPWRGAPATSPIAPAAGTPARPHPSAAESPLIADDRGRPRLAWGIAFAGLALSAALASTVMERIDKEPAVLFALLVPAIAMLALIAGLRGARDLHRFGRLHLHMDPFPGAAGGDVGGTVEIPQHYTPGDSFTVTLTCMCERETDGSGRRREHAIVWQERGTPHASPSPRGIRLTFRFTPPDGLPASNQGPGDRCRWSVRLEGRLRDARLDRTFTIPVAAGTERSAARLPDAVEPPDPRAVPDLPPGIVRLERRPDGIVLFQPAGRHAGGAALLAIVGLAFAAMAGGLGWAIFDQAWLLAGFGAVIGLLVAIVALMILAIAALMAGGTLTVRAARSGLEVEHRWLGLRVANHRIDTADLDGIDIDVSSRTTVGRRQTTRLRLRARRKAGKSVTLGDGLPDIHVATYLRRLIVEACRLEFADTPHRDRLA